MRFSVCSGTDNSRTELQDENRINQLIRQYQNCTRVYGNLEITYIRREHLNETDPEQFFSFLSHIQQITGYLLIYANDFDRITLRNLEIIWGDTRHDEIAAIDISYNDNLKYVNMPKLRSVERGDIVLMHNPYLCNWNTTVSYNEIIGKASELRVQFMSNFEKCDHAQSGCAEKCGKHCWGPDADMCQIVYREICPKDCPSQMCYQSDNRTHCCDEACAAGCFGEGKSACIACAKLEQDSKCVDKCNGLTDYDRTLKLTVNHSNPRYTYDRYCVEQCPAETLIQGEYCVVHCTEGYWHDPVKNTRICEKCPDGICPKICYMNEPIDSSNIGSLANCTVVEGFIQILRHPFDPHRKFFTDGRTPVYITGLTLKMLEALKNVKIVTEFVEIQAGECSPPSLSFLGNLTTIEGRKLSDQQHALLITSNQNLLELGLRSLKRIRNGRVYIGNNEKLCYADSLKEYWKEIMQTDTASTLVIVNRNGPDCANRKQFCDSTCDKTYGCWGAGPSMCVKCIDYNVDGKCSATCPSQGYYIKDNECYKCHPQCRSCNGPTARDCIACMNVRIQQGNEWECIAECPKIHYFDGNICLPCNSACYDFGCTGPSNVVGKGGCNKCKYAKRTDNGQELLCLYTAGKPKDVCRDNNLTHYYAAASSSEMLVAEFECDECSEECLSCAGYGTSVKRHKCTCAHYLTKTGSDSDYCTMKCKMDSFMVRPKSNSTIGECERCNELCDLSMGCAGRSSTNCTRCAKAGISIGDKLICLERCPVDRPFIADDKICHDTDPAVYALKRRMYIIIIGVLCAAVLIAIIAGITINCIKYKKRYQQELEMNLPSIPEYEQTDPSMRPNMTRLCIITNENLEKTEQSLGQGAFGTVFLGYWWPKGKDDGEKLAVAIKVVHDSSGTAHQEMLQEAGIMACMRHEHLLRLVGVCLSDGMQIVTPMRPLGSLKNYLKKHRQKLSARDLLLYCYQIASAMEYLYKNRLVHRDLAARNVLVKRTNHVEVTDFGLARLLEKGKSEIVVGGKVAVKWLALESLEKQIYTHYTDVWAFGVTCWEVLTFGQTPFQSVPPDRIRQHLANGNRLEQPNNCAQEVYQTILQCWLQNPESRPSFVILKEKFKQYCKAPHLYVLDHYHKRHLDSVLFGNQHELCSGLMDSNELPNQFKFSGGTIVTSTSVPPSPTTPTWMTFQQHTLNVRQDKRIGSADSGRYQSDPVHDGCTELNMDEGNYLVPNNKLILYTPVLVRENGVTELVKSSEYYNDKVGSDYYNQLKSVSMEMEEETKSIKITTYQNDYYFAENETSL
ncbi:TK/EGFR protein kinase [Loa loa]|uniref:receptor protein-tyrosine kinase n=1 Tax=Loa loa TaxID=7209 RepID=A0A1S0TXZ4_LOALO|nr:TK/EGFR protein kinase [Loa loa]EFO21962.2 TK/EGFR protein kinase [Loa loa]